MGGWILSTYTSNAMVTTFANFGLFWIIVK